MTDLRSLLETATDRLEAPHRVSLALAEGRRRRRTRAAVAVGTAALAGAAAVGGLVVGPTGGEDPAVPPSTPPPSVLPSPPGADDPATQPRWDPFDVPDLPRRDTLLPERLDPPDRSLPEIAESPVEQVLLAWPEEGQDLRLLGVDGEWRVVPGTADAVGPALRRIVRPAISSDGRQVAYATVDGLVVLDVTRGSSRTLAWPADIAPPWDISPGLLWRAGDEDLVVLHWRRPWLMGLDGSAAPAPYRGRFVALAADPAGPVLQNDFELRRLLTWDGDEVVDETPFVQCERLAAAHGLVACTAGSMRPFFSGPVVVDATTGEIVAYAPIRDRNAVYSDNAHLTVRGFLDEGTVLLDVGPAAFGREGAREGAWHLVAWEFRTGRFELVATAGELLQAAPVLADAID